MSSSLNPLKGGLCKGLYGGPLKGSLRGILGVQTMAQKGRTEKNMEATT